MKWFHLIIFSIFTGLLLSLGWPENGYTFILFFSLVPIFFVEDYFFLNSRTHKKIYVFFYSFISFLLWNVLTTCWIVNSTVFGAWSAFLLNSFFMAFTFYVFHLCRHKFKSKLSIFFLIPLWIAFEYFHLDWDLSWPWLNLGNAFATAPKWIQWYEYTGVFGGSFWILISNIFVFLLIKSFINNRTLKIKLSLSIALILLIIIPILVSDNIYKNYKEKAFPVNVVVVQPNIDPYNEKFTVSSEIQTDKMLNLSFKEVDSTTDFVVFPESAIQENVWERRLRHSVSINKIKKQLLNKNPYLNVIIGASSFKMFLSGEKKSSTARKIPQEDIWYDAYNSGFLINNFDKIQIYHKSKLVPGVEIMPFAKLFKPLEKFALNMGGTSGSLGTTKNRTTFLSSRLLNVSTVICYESIYGGFCSEFVKNGASIIFVITNDGWWGNTQGYKQHFEYARLRAIENRRSIVRSANTGRSGIINQRGDVIKSTPYWEEDVIKSTINSNTELTFYTKHGDYLGKIFVFLSGVIILFSLFKNFWRKN